jgi:MerR family mercuric resistance operon transcriptional regulator
MKRKRRGVRRIGDLARDGGVGVETIRFYEREGLIEQPAKPMRGWREYGDRQALQLSYVRLGQELGLTLRDVRGLQGVARGDKSAFCGAVRETVAKRLAALDAEIAALKQKRAGLARWLTQCKARGRAARCPLYEQLQPVVGSERSRRR